MIISKSLLLEFIDDKINTNNLNNCNSAREMLKGTLTIENDNI